MSTNTDFIQKTKDLLGCHISKPELKDNLLQRPPFKFIHGIIREVVRKHGYMSGLFTDEELVHENVQEKEKKVKFIKKIQDYTSYVLKKDIELNPVKLVCGFEVENTNNLLQCIGEAISLKIDNEHMFQRYKRHLEKNNEASKSQHGIKTNKKEMRVVKSDSIDVKKSKKSNMSSIEKEAKGDSSKTDEDNKETKILEQNNQLNSENQPIKAELDLLSYESDNAETLTQNVLSLHKKSSPQSAETVPSQSCELNPQETNKSKSSSHQPKVGDNLILQPVEIPHKISPIESIKQPNIIPNEPSHHQEIVVVPNKSEFVDISRPIEPEPVETINMNNELKTETWPKTSKKPSGLNDTQNILEPVKENLEQKITQISEPNSVSNFKEKEFENQFGTKKSVVQMEIRKINPVENQIADPIMDTLVANIMIEGEEAAEDEVHHKVNLHSDEDNVEFMDRWKSRDVAENGETIGKHGALVTKLIRKKLQKHDNKEDSELMKLERENTNRDMLRLRSEVQDLTRGCARLAHLFDYVQEDVDAMYLECAMWRREHLVNTTLIQKELELTKSMLEPLNNELNEINVRIIEVGESNAALRRALLDNQEKIIRLTRQLISGHPF